MNYLDKHIDDLKARMDKINAENAPARAERDALIAEIQPLEAKLRQVQKLLKAAEAPLRELGNEYAAAVRAKPATKSLSTAEET